VVPHPPYSPDLAPCDFFLFPRLTSLLKSHRFEDVNETIETRAKGYNYKENSKVFQKVARPEAKGHYFEGDPFK